MLADNDTYYEFVKSNYIYIYANTELIMFKTVRTNTESRKAQQTYVLGWLR